MPPGGQQLLLPLRAACWEAMDFQSIRNKTAQDASRTAPQTAPAGLHQMKLGHCGTINLCSEVCQCHQHLNFRRICSTAHLRGFCLIWANSRANSDTAQQVRCHICPLHTRGRALCQQSSASPSPQTQPALHPAPPCFS